jgi:hypothetical protein
LENIPLFYIGRGICGLGVGLNATLVPIYIKEISPDAITQKTQFFNLVPIYDSDKGVEEMSGKTGSCHYLMVAVGIVMSSVIRIGDKFDDDKYQLYLSFGFPIVTCSLRILLFY